METKKRFSIGMNPILLGLCDGISNYTSVDAWIVRVLFFVILYLITGSLIINFLLYVLIAFFMPQHKSSYQIDREYRANNNR